MVNMLTGPNSFAWIVGIGAAFGLVWTWNIAGKVKGISQFAKEKRSVMLLNAGLVALASMLAGARLAYVLIHWPYFSSHIAEIFYVWLGGLDWIGGLFGLAVGMLFFAGFGGHSLREMMDGLLPLWTALTISIWLGFGQVGLYSGKVAADTWYALPMVDQLGETLNRIPLPWIGAIFSILLAFMIEIYRPLTKRSGIRAAVFFAGQMLLVYLFSYLRADPVPMMGALPIDRIFSLIYFVIIAVISSVFTLRSRN